MRYLQHYRRDFIAIGLLLMFAAGSESANAEIQRVEGDIEACAIALSASSGDRPDDRVLEQARRRVNRSATGEAHLERLGWSYVRKARSSFDPGYYQLAEQTGQCMESRYPGSAAALLLRGHALRSLHRFHESLPIAEELVRRRGLSFDYALLGDVLLDIGRLDDAANAYQQMMDQKPGPHAYVRAAELRWLLGHKEGAAELWRIAYKGTESGDPEAAAWVRVRLARYNLEVGQAARADRMLREALAISPNYPPALLWQGRALLDAGRPTEALSVLVPAAAANPLPDYYWTLRDAYLEAGNPEEAKRTEQRLMSSGRQEDPRSFALFLATTSQQTDLARQLALEELASRQDVMTLDAVAWTAYVAGDPETAARYCEQALAVGIRDPRLLLHAAVIMSAQAGSDSQAILEEVQSLVHLLLPSEREWLQRTALYEAKADSVIADQSAANGRSESSQ